MPFTAFFVFDHDPLLTALCALVAALVIYCHRENIRRLLQGHGAQIQVACQSRSNSDDSE